jgi:site-specific DNA-methyltransferase (adenine-specific)
MLPNFWTELEDAFLQDWKGKRIWCNPPYGGRGKGGIYRWVNKFATGGAEVVCALLPSRTDTRWFHDFIYKKKNVEVRFIKGRIKFSGTSGSGKFPSMVVIFKS